MLKSAPLPALLLAGLAGELTFEFYAWVISPTLFGVALQPANLVSALAAITLGLPLPYSVAFALHFLLGAVGFALFLWIIKRISGFGYIASGTLTGLILWFIAQGILAPVVGRSFMMDFGAYTQSSLIAHVGMMTVTAWVWKTLSERKAVAL